MKNDERVGADMKRRKAVNRLIDLCEATAQDITREDVRVEVDELFAALCPMENSMAIRTIGIDIVSEDKKSMKAHQKIENELFYNVEKIHNFCYFTIAFYHEIGHLMTMKYFKDHAIDKFMTQYKSASHDLERYKMLPHEVLADNWSLGIYMPEHMEDVAAFDKRVRKLLKHIY